MHCMLHAYNVEANGLPDTTQTKQACMSKLTVVQMQMVV